jgi:hypothetical protein
VTEPTPRSATEAIAYARTQVGHGVYELGTGDWNSTGEDARDCAGFAICECYGLKRHRPGFNNGPWASVSDDLNVNSAIEDAQNRRELFTVVDAKTQHPMPGDLLCYPTIRVKGMDGQMKQFIGHVGILSDTSGWNGAHWDSLKIIQCCGPNGHKPGIVEGWASHWDGHDLIWSKPQHRSVLIRRKM